MNTHAGDNGRGGGGHIKDYPHTEYTHSNMKAIGLLGFFLLCIAVGRAVIMRMTG